MAPPQKKRSKNLPNNGSKSHQYRLQINEKRLQMHNMPTVQLNNTKIGAQLYTKECWFVKRRNCNRRKQNTLHRQLGINVIITPTGRPKIKEHCQPISTLGGPISSTVLKGPLGSVEKCENVKGVSTSCKSFEPPCLHFFFGFISILYGTQESQEARISFSLKNQPCTTVHAIQLIVFTKIGTKGHPFEPFPMFWLFLHTLAWFCLRLQVFAQFLHITQHDWPQKEKKKGGAPKDPRKYLLGVSIPKKWPARLSQNIKMTRHI